MITFEKALEIIQNTSITAKYETISVTESLNRINYGDVYSEIDIPSFNKSRMDGYAYNSVDNTDFYTINEVIPAGEVPGNQIKQNQCSKIMTGAIIPDGADKVIRKEFVEEKDNKIRILQIEQDSNISRKGQFINKGEEILSKSTVITPSKIGLLVSCGVNELKVYKKPLIGIIVTGNEIVEPGQNPDFSQIFNANGYVLINLLKNWGLNYKYYGICGDDKENLNKIIEEAFNDCDLVLLSGGVSKGDFDFVPEILKEIGTDIKFHGVMVKPGKPLMFGSKNIENKRKYVFGIPGNPVSCFVCFEIFIKPFIFLMQGCEYNPVLFKGKLSRDFSRSDFERTEFVPSLFDGENIFINNYSTSDNIKFLAEANALIKIDAGQKSINQGEVINVRQI